METLASNAGSLPSHATKHEGNVDLITPKQQVNASETLRLYPQASERKNGAERATPAEPGPVSTERRALAGARIGLLAGREPPVLTLAAAMEAEGAHIERIEDGDSRRADESSFDLVIVRVERVAPAAPGRRSGPLPREEFVRGLAHRQRVLALLDDTAEPTLSSECEFALPPFRPLEVIPRVVRLLRSPRPSPSMRLGGLELNAANRTVLSAGEPIPLTFTEFEILSVLLAARGGVVSRDDLHRRLGGEDAASGRRVDIHIHRLRGKLPASSGVTVDTVRNVGYRLSFARPAV